MTVHIIHCMAIKKSSAVVRVFTKHKEMVRVFTKHKEMVREGHETRAKVSCKHFKDPAFNPHKRQ